MAGADAVVYDNMAVFVQLNVCWVFVSKSFMSTRGFQSFSFPV